MKRLSKTLAVFLCLAMLISCIPGVVFTAKATEATITQPQGVSIVENYDSYVGEDWVAQLGMPAKVTTSDGEADVQWADAAKYVDLKTPGYYFVPGTVNGVAQAVYFPVQVREYSNLFDNYNGSLESALYWSIRDNQNFTTDPVKHGTYATNQIMPKGWVSGTAGDALYSYNKYSDIPANFVTETGAGQYWFGTWAQIGANTQDPYEVNDNFQLCVYMKRTTTLVENVASMSENENLVSYDASRAYTGDFVRLNADAYTRVGLVAELDGTDEHLRFYVKPNSDVAYDILHLDNMELIPLKLALTEVPAIITDVVKPVALSVIKDYNTYVGDDWQTALALPTEVDVTLDNGIGKAAVKWDYSNLDLTTPGWYVLTGKLISEDYANPSGLTVEQVIYVHSYSNLLAEYNGSLESALYWSIRNNQNFTTDPVMHGTYATNQTMPNWNPGVAGDILFSYNKYSDIPADFVTETGAGQYWFGLWAQIGANTQTEKINENFQLRVYMKRTTTLVENVGSMTENENLISYDSSRMYTGEYVKLNADTYTRVGLLAELDGTDEHLRFFANPNGRPMLPMMFCIWTTWNWFP